MTKGPALSHPVTRDGTPIPFFPIGKRIVVERIESEDQMGGIIIPETSKVPHGLATILAAGPAAMGVLSDAGISIGDTISIAKYAGVEWEWQPVGTNSIADRHRAVLITVDDILGCKELAEKMIDGRLGISLYQPTKGCSGCTGTGRVYDIAAGNPQWQVMQGSMMAQRECRECSGTGSVPHGDPEYRFMQETSKAA